MATVDPKGSEPLCAQLTCVTDTGGKCGKSTHAPDDDVCVADETFAIEQTSDNCLAVQCLGKGAFCRGRAPPCEALVAHSTEATLENDTLTDADGCPRQMCVLNDARLTEDMLGVTSADYNAKKKMLRSSYKVKTLTSGGVTLTAGSLLTRCPGVDLDLLRMACPTYGVQTACIDWYSTPANTFQSVLNKLVLYRTEDDAVCFGIIHPVTHEHISGFDDNALLLSCAQGEANCCGTPPSPVTPIAEAIECLPASYFVTVRVTNASAGQVFSLTDPTPTTTTYTFGNAEADFTIYFPVRLDNGTAYTVTSPAGCTPATIGATLDGEAHHAVHCL